jgi:hypothetical protein
MTATEQDPVPVKPVAPATWPEFFRQMAREHGLPTTVIIAVLAFAMWQNKEQTEKLIQITEDGTHAVTASTEQSRDVESVMIRTNTLLSRLYRKLGEEEEP